MDQHKNLLLLADDPHPSLGRILRIILAKAAGAYVLLFAAWYLWIFGVRPVMDAYGLIAEQKRILTGTQPSLLSTLHDLFTASGAYSFLADASFVQPLKGWDKTPTAQKIPFIDVWGPAYATGKFDEVTPHYAEVQDAITQMVNDAVFDGVPVKDAAKKASDAVTRILQG